MGTGQFKVFKHWGKWRWKFIGANGKYKNKSYNTWDTAEEAIKAIEVVKKFSNDGQVKGAKVIRVD